VRTQLAEELVCSSELNVSDNRTKTSVNLLSFSPSFSLGYGALNLRNRFNGLPLWRMNGGVIKGRLGELLAQLVNR